MRLDELDYVLPADLIATHPLEDRDASRMLCLHRASGELRHGSVRDLPSHLPPGALLVVNDTRVIPARLRGTKATGGRAEVLLLRPLDPDARRWSAFGRASKPLRAGARIDVAEGFALHVEKRLPDASLELHLACVDPWQSIDAHGEVPLPPYLRRAAQPQDRERYQTVYAAHPGAVAAPTAGLHLSHALLAALAARGIERATLTLHVGAGTFAPVTAADLDEHPMHPERYVIPEATADAVRRAVAERRAVVAVGTTVTRALETWGAGAPLQGETRLLIQPGHAFRVVTGLLTNFHLPRSTLLALLMAFAGVEPVRRAYAAAVEARYRFYSYGDAMLVV